MASLNMSLVKGLTKLTAGFILADLAESVLKDILFIVPEIIQLKSPNFRIDTMTKLVEALILALLIFRRHVLNTGPDV